MDKEQIEKIINEYLEHVRRYSWQHETTKKEKMSRFLESDVVKNLTIPVVRVCCLCGANFTPSEMYPKDAVCGNCHKKLRGY